MLSPVRHRRDLGRWRPYSPFSRTTASCQTPTVHPVLKLQFWLGCQNKMPSTFRGSVWHLPFWLLPCPCLLFVSIKEQRDKAKKKKKIQYIIILYIIIYSLTSSLRMSRDPLIFHVPCNAVAGREILNVT